MLIMNEKLIRMLQGAVVANFEAQEGRNKTKKNISRNSCSSG